MRKIFLVLILLFPLFGMELQLKSGSVSAHTEMLMDSTIDPVNNNLNATISIENNDITTIKGKFWIEMSLFESDEADRDEHMHESTEAEKYKLATYIISSVIKAEGKDNYTINGKLDFHGQEKELSANAMITSVDGNLNIDADSMILVSDYGIEMPCMVFMCVRDQVDLKIKAEF